MVKLASLNEQQKEAVKHMEGPVVVVAGAGTGKTRTIAYRTAYLIENGIDPANILAITFTNKAAREMRERISKMVGEETRDLMTVSTIHSLCVRMLRADIGALGRDTQFSIFDTTDQTGLVRKALIDNGFDPQKNDPRGLLWKIGKIKNVFPIVESEDFANPVFRRVYESYNSMLEKNNALDFDDLLIFASRLLEKKKILEKYQDRFRYIMVDEYQDINGCQYGLIRKLAEKRRNLYVVGDDDQSVYGWRGAQVANILNFERDFKGAKVIKLERNYRSTGAIIEAANSVIANNETRRAKKLWTSEREGLPVSVIAASDEREESARVLDFIISERQKNKLNFGDFAILYRTNAQSRLFEERLMRLGVSYIMIGGTRFFERREIKDVTAYLRAALNPDDEVSLSRVVNFPARGVGKTTLERIRERAFESKTPLYEALRAAVSDAATPAKARDGLRQFTSVCEELKKSAEQRPSDPAAAIKLLLKKVDFKSAYDQISTDKNTAARRVENIAEFVNAVVEYQRNEPRPSLEGFLENIALMSEEKEIEEELREDSVVLMTLHSAKGLEFKVVFIVGAEEGYLPHELSEAEGNLEEERRLFYVGMTRARKRLFISYACSRSRYGEEIPREPSRFIEEIPPRLLVREGDEEFEKAKAAAGAVIVDRSRARIEELFSK